LLLEKTSTQDSTERGHSLGVLRQCLERQPKVHREKPALGKSGLAQEGSQGKSGLAEEGGQGKFGLAQEGSQGKFGLAKEGSQGQSDITEEGG
jgi:hypothetical protein